MTADPELIFLFSAILMNDLFHVIYSLADHRNDPARHPDGGHLFS